MKHTQIILIAIVVLAAILRLTALGKIPAGFTPDEASQGYTAYSLLKTGRDEWGVYMPIASFRSFLDYKAPLQTYLMVPSVALFGLNEFAVRLPSAIMGILSILVLYQLVMTLGTKFLIEEDRRIVDALAILAAGTLAISPWHLQFSRMALEASTATFLILTGLWLFIKGLNSPKYWLGSGVAFGFSMYAYHSAKIFVPLILVALAWLFAKSIKSRKTWICLILPLFILLIPLVLDTLLGQGGTRGADLLIFNLNDLEVKSILDQRFYSPLSRISPVLPAIFHNKLTFIADKFIENYFSYFNLSFWFVEGGREITYSIIPGRGLLYTWLVIPLLAGIVFLIIHYRQKKLALLILIWLLLAAVPAAITKEGYRPNRASPYLGLLEIIIAFGGYYLWRLAGKHRHLMAGIGVILAVISLGFYLDDYAFAGQVKYPDSMAYGWREAAAFIKANGDRYESVYVQKAGQPQAMIAFYFEIPPEDFQKESIAWAQDAKQQKVTYLDQLGSYQLGRFRFEPLNFPEDIKPNTLYLSSGPFELLPQNRNTLHTVLSGADRPQLELFTFTEINR